MVEAASQLDTFRAKAIGTNVNAVTLLATDYLNHFNEALMLAELVVDMPEMLDDFSTWSPKHYKDHFRESGIADKDLAIEAFDVSPSEYKAPFESTVGILNKQLSLLQKTLDSDRENLGTPERQEFIRAKCALIRDLIDRVSGIINGQVSAKTAATKDRPAETKRPEMQPGAQGTAQAVKPSSAKIDVSDGERLDQSDIDALFD